MSAKRVKVCLLFLELSAVLFVYVFVAATLYTWLVWRRDVSASSPEQLYYSLLWFMGIVLVILEVGVLMQMELFLNHSPAEEEDEEQKTAAGVLLISGWQAASILICFAACVG